MATFEPSVGYFYSWFFLVLSIAAFPEPAEGGAASGFVDMVGSRFGGATEARESGCSLCMYCIPGSITEGAAS